MNRRFHGCVPTFASWPLLLLCIAFGGCALVPLSADPIDSQVVDGTTGAPIEGAVVLAYWELHSGSFTGDSLPCGAVNVQDAVTDKDGRFHIPGWGPTLPGCSGSMYQGNPQLYVFKPGYHYVDVPNGHAGSTTIVMTTHNAWKGRQLKLTPITDMNMRSYNSEVVRDFSSLETSMDLFYTEMPTECNWKRAQNMTRALAKQWQSFHRAGLGHYGIIGAFMSNDSWYQKVAPQCGSPKAFIEGLLK